MNPDNPVIRLCAEGMRAETEHRPDDAHRLFIQAWETSQDDYEKCIAAHFLARQQENPQDALRWNQEALTRADAIGDIRVQGFYPSLYLNLGFCHEVLGNKAEARRCYELAGEKLDDVPDGPYKEVVTNGIAQARKRAEEIGP
jgi:tetratricopeptide (TPR) repeat protein